MSRITSAVFLAAMSALTAPLATAATEAGREALAGAGASGNRAVLALISQLGDDQYSVRRRAEDELIRLGPEAFDDLRQAEQSADLEIAERARYILLRMRVEWVRPEDSPEVRRALTRYGDLSNEEKRKRIARLAELKEGEGLPALCRIARLDTSPITAREAALAVLTRDRGSFTAFRDKLAEVCQQELGVSERPPAVWLKLWLREAADKRATLADWDAAIQAEAALLDGASPETSAAIVYPLMRRRLTACHELGLVNETTTALLQIADLSVDDESSRRRTGAMAWALNWIIDHQRWDVLDQVVVQRGRLLQQDRRLLYYYAAATAGAGREEQARDLAGKAFAMGAGEAKERVSVAEAVVRLGMFDWAEREYQRALEDLPVVSAESLRARSDWAMWLHDRNEYAKAAAVLDGFFQEYRDDRAARQQLIQDLDGREEINAMAARAEYYRACDLAAQKKFAEQREVLEKAWRQSEDDPDILIAMYRSEGADEAYRVQTRQRIQQLSQKHLALIEQYPEYPSFHNQWAWLVSNTEGDYAKAVEHSLKSLELSPDEASYLDTLGRCYYAAGELEKAVEVQQRAVELEPHFGVMRRQLELFERELEAKDKGS